jgi:hypothetical protein
LVVVIVVVVASFPGFSDLPINNSTGGVFGRRPNGKSHRTSRECTFKPNSHSSLDFERRDCLSASANAKCRRGNNNDVNRNHHHLCYYYYYTFSLSPRERERNKWMDRRMMMMKKWTDGGTSVQLFNLLPYSIHLSVYLKSYLSFWYRLYYLGEREREKGRTLRFIYERNVRIGT